MSEASQTRGPAPASGLPAGGQTRQRRNAAANASRSPVYDGLLSELFLLVGGNLLRNVVTAGFYRFWAKTRLRHYFLSRVSFLDDRLVYTGTGAELFIGFVLILGVLVPYFAGFEVFKDYASRQATVVSVFAQVVYYGSFMFLMFTAVYRAQRYRLSRVTWRGIRGGQTGSAFIYAIRAMAWSAAVLMTVGFAYPLMRNDLMAYRISNARFGRKSFWYTGGAGPLFFYWMLPWISVLMIAGCVLVLFGTIGTVNITEAFDNMTQEESEAANATIMNLIPVVLGALGLFFLSNFWYRAAEVRHFAEHTTFNKLRFESRLRGLMLFLPYLSYGLLVAFVYGGGFALLVVGLQFIYSSNTADGYGTFPMLTGFGIVFLLIVGGFLLKPLLVQTFESRMNATKLFLICLAFGVLMFFVLLGAIILFAASAEYFNWNEMAGEHPMVSMFVGFGIAILFLGTASVIKSLIVQNLLVRNFCESLKVKGDIESDKLLQSQMKTPRRGEGLADAFDIDGF